MHIRTILKCVPLLAALSAATLLAASPAAAFTDAQHRAMMRSPPAYAQADKELNAAWRELRAALKSAGMQGQLDGGDKPPHVRSLLASQREWLAQRDSEAERLRAGGSTVDGHIAAIRERTAFLRERARAVRAFAALPAPAPNAPFMQLLRANGREMGFQICSGESGTPQQRCASTTPSSLNFSGDGTALWVADSGGIGNLYMGHHWKLLPDGRVRVITWENAADYTLHDGRYLESNGEWYVLIDGSDAGELGQPD